MVDDGGQRMKTGIWWAAPLRRLGVGLGALAALLVVLFVLAPGSRHNGPITHPTGGGDIVIQMQWGGGMVPYLEGQTDRFPQFTLYGDGTLIYHTRDYYQTRLDEAAIQR